MAVIDTAPGLEITIVVDGKPLEEYRNEDDPEEEGTITSWIEAVDGANFAVKLETKTGFDYRADCLECNIHVDGHWANCPLLSKEDPSQISTGREVSGERVAKYRFTDLESVDNGNVVQREKQTIAGFGTIRVATTFVNVSGEFGGFSDDLYLGFDIPSEKDLKGSAVTHKVQFDDPSRMAEPSYYVSTTKVANGPTFVFKYRSREALKALYILPRTRSPTPLEERDPTTLNADELRELQEQLKALKSKQAAVKIKQEHADDNQRPHKSARRTRASTQVEIDDDGFIREGTASTIREEPEVIVID